MLFEIHRAKLLQLYSLHPMDKYWLPCHQFLTVTTSYHSKVTLIGPLHTDKITESVLLYVFELSFPASLFCL